MLYSMFSFVICFIYKEIGSFVKMWIDLESVTQSEVTKRKIDIIY